MHRSYQYLSVDSTLAFKNATRLSCEALADSIVGQIHKLSPACFDHCGMHHSMHTVIS